MAEQTHHTQDGEDNLQRTPPDQGHKELSKLLD
jgi:hypothetical protein